MAFQELEDQIRVLQKKLGELQPQVAGINSGTIPPGTIILWRDGGTPSGGYLPCDGSQYPVASYPALWASGGVFAAYGDNNGVTGFATPGLPKVTGTYGNASYFIKT